jgi:hypothetical protein
VVLKLILEVSTTYQRRQYSRFDDQASSSLATATTCVCLFAFPVLMPAKFKSLPGINTYRCLVRFCLPTGFCGIDISHIVSEWLTWSTSQELRDLSLLYRLIRTAFRSLFMHLSIFLFFAGLLVLMWNESTMAVCGTSSLCSYLISLFIGFTAVPSVAVGLFVVRPCMITK